MGFYDSSLNKVQLIGNIGGEIKFNDAKTMVYFSLATKESVFDKATNTSTDKTEWFNVKAIFPSLIKLLSTLSKGDMIYVEGSIHSFEKENSKSFYVLIKDAMVLKKKPQEAPNQVHSKTSEALLDDDIPF